MPATLSNIGRRGHAGGKIKGNLHLREKDGTPMANIMLTMMQKLGVPISQFGDSNGIVEI